MDLPEANKLLKYIPEVVPTLNSYDNMCAHERKNTISCLHTIRKNKDDETRRNTGAIAVIYIIVCVTNTI